MYPVQVTSGYHLAVASSKDRLGRYQLYIHEVSSVVKSYNCWGVILLGLPRRKSVYIVVTLNWLTIFSFDARGWQDSGGSLEVELALSSAGA